jgi:hypothetical protein
MQIKGEITNANTSPAFPASPTVGDVWIITTNAGTVGGVAVDIGDQLIYSTSGWFVLEHNLVDATTVIKGYVRLATQAEVNVGANSTAAVVPSTLFTNLNTDVPRPKIYRQAIATLTANTPLTITHNLALGNAQDYQIHVTDATGTIKVSDVAVGVNSLTIESNKTYTSLRVTVIGL